jgi:hypothetical protein
VSPALSLLSLDDVVHVTSAYAINEAERNLDTVTSRARLYRLLRQTEIADEAPVTVTLPTSVNLPAKDQPILRAAIHARCSHLLTGDQKHFGHLFGRSVEGVHVMTVRDFLNARATNQDRR